MIPTKTAAGTNNIANRLSSLGPRMTARACSHPCTRLNRLPARMTRPTMKGKVPDSTPAADQPMPLTMLETATAAPNAPVMSAVAASRLRPETIIVALEPFPFRLNRNGALSFCFDAFSSREPVSTSLENALIGDQPTLVGGNLAGAFDVVLDELAEGVAGQESVGLRGPLDIFLPFRR